MSVTFQERFGEVLEEKGWTQQTLSKRSGVHAQQIHKLLSGEIKDPRLSTVRRLAEALKISIDYLADFKVQEV